MGIQDLLKDEQPEAFTPMMGVLADEINSLISVQNQIADAEAELQRLKREERDISEQKIPAIMDELNMDRITLKDGRTVQVKDMVQCSIPVEKKPGAFVWMDEHGHGDLIKTVVTAKFNRGEQAYAKEAADLLEQQLGIHADLLESVHPGTLKAWARKELEAGRALPQDFFKVYTVRQATVK